MSNWIQIQLSDLYDAEAAALVDAANSAELGAGQENRTTQVIADVTAEIRRKVAKCNQLDQNVAAIPGGLKNLALDIIISRLKRALHQELSQDEKDALKAHERSLNRIADGEDLVDPPDNPMPANMTQAIAQPKFGHRPPREFSPWQQDG